jgi:hypothetical protein
MAPRSASQFRPQYLYRAFSSNSAKHSYRSYSSSFEADDERSSSADDMGPEGALRDDPSQFPGEDTRLTSRKELLGWYAYGFAAEVFVICGIGESPDPFEALFEVTMLAWILLCPLRRCRAAYWLGSILEDNYCHMRLLLSKVRRSRAKSSRTALFQASRS